MTNNQKNILLTGTSSGIVKSTALYLAQKHCFLFLIVMCFITNINAQSIDSKHVVIDGKIFTGNILAHDKEVSSFLLDGSHNIYSLAVGYRTLPSDSSQIASDFNYPIFGLGLSMADFGRVKMTENSHLGNVYTLFGFFDRTIFRVNRFRMNYRFETGLSYATNPYNPISNPTNEFVSSPIMVYVGIGVGLHYRITNQIELGLGADLKHYSNGRLGMPNKGMNISGLSAQLQYDLTPKTEVPTRMHSGNFDKKWEYHITAGTGLQKSYAEWQIYAKSQPNPELKKIRYKSYFKYSLSGDAMYRFSEKYSLGVGLDIFATPYTDKLRQWDEILHQRQAEKYDPISVGISLNQEINYKRFALAASIGYYAHHQLGIEENLGHIYQKAGVRYYFPKTNGLFIGYSIKAHSFRLAEYLEFSIGKKF